MNTRGASSREAEFSDFYDASWRRTVACAYAVTGELAAAEDAAQEAYTKAWPRWTKLQSYEDPGAWVCQVATRQAISRWRRQGTAQRFLARSRPPETQAAPDPTRLVVAQALRQLPEAQRRAVVLHHLGGFRIREIADVEEVPEGTIKARLARGRATLAELIGDDHHTPIRNENGEHSHA